MYADLRVLNINLNITMANNGNMIRLKIDNSLINSFCADDEPTKCVKLLKLVKNNKYMEAVVIRTYQHRAVYPVRHRINYPRTLVYMSHLMTSGHRFTLHNCSLASSITMASLCQSHRIYCRVSFTHRHPVTRTHTHAHSQRPETASQITIALILPYCKQVF